MTLPVFPNPISLNQVNVELGLAGTTLISLNQASVRTLAGVPSGAISMNNLHGKSNRATLTVNYTTSTANASIGLTSLPGYIFGKTDLIINVNAGVYLYASGTGFLGLLVQSANTGDTVTINNSGYIIGAGGKGGDSYQGVAGTSAFNGGSALQTSGSFSSSIINNNSGAYIAGGGGGGAGGIYGAGGGGAGGGAGGDAYDSGSTLLYTGGAGGSIGASGSNGTYIFPIASGGGGGRVLPSTITFGSSSAGGVGGSGGGTGGGGFTGTPGYGGGPNQAGFSPSNDSGSGGGGWGAAGGNKSPASGGSAGAAIIRSGISTTINNSGAIYGAVI